MCRPFHWAFGTISAEWMFLKMAERSSAMLLIHGITHIDLANNYGPPPGSAEENFGAILKKDFPGNLRDELIISSKAGYLMWPGPYGEWGSRKYLICKR